MTVIDAVSDDFSLSMFIDVHKIVHDSFFSSIAVVNPVITKVYGVIGSSVSGIFMNIWTILFFVSIPPKCLERPFLLAW